MESLSILLAAAILLPLTCLVAAYLWRRLGVRHRHNAKPGPYSETLPEPYSETLFDYMHRRQREAAEANHATHLDPAEWNLIEYLNPSLIPADLYPVGFINTNASPSVMRIVPTWVLTKAAAARNQRLVGAVRYASEDLVPANLKRVTSV